MAQLGHPQSITLWKFLHAVSCSATIWTADSLSQFLSAGSSSSLKTVLSFFLILHPLAFGWCFALPTQAGLLPSSCSLFCLLISLPDWCCRFGFYHYLVTLNAQAFKVQYNYDHKSYHFLADWHSKPRPTFTVKNGLIGVRIFPWIPIQGCLCHHVHSHPRTWETGHRPLMPTLKIGLGVRSDTCESI